MKTTIALTLLAVCAIQLNEVQAQGRPQGRGTVRGQVKQAAPAANTNTDSLASAPDAAIRQALLETYDANKNGKLDPAERAQVRADIEAGKLDLPEGAGPKQGHRPHRVPAEIAAQYDANKDGKLDETERAALKADIESGKITIPHPPLPVEILAAYDVNKDGKLDETERAALRADVESGKVTLPRRGGHPRRGAGDADNSDVELPPIPGAGN